jgi:hypothetical protein
VFLLLLGIGARWQALAIFILMTALHHRNTLILDGGDIMLRWIAFSLIWMPSDDYFSIKSYFKRRRGWLPIQKSAPGLRILQIQLTLVYISTLLLKLDGADWLDGQALFYVVQLDDLFGYDHLPSMLVDSATFLTALTYLVLCVEFFMPIGLWLSATRRYTICLGIGFHLAINYAMNLFLFQWFMILGLCAFVDWPRLIANVRDWAQVRSRRKSHGLN